MTENSYMLRYIVPFSYDMSGDGVAAYDRVCTALKESCGRWEQVFAGKEQSDCYEYMKSLYSMKKDAGSYDTAVGSVWTRVLDGKKDAKVEITYDVTSDKKLVGGISDAGLYITKNGVGLFWYEVKFDNDEDIRLEELVSFQNLFKELCRRLEDEGLNQVLRGDVQFSYADDKVVCEELDILYQEGGKKRSILLDSNRLHEKTPKLEQLVEEKRSQISKEFNGANVIVTKVVASSEEKNVHVSYEFNIHTAFGIWVNHCLADLKAKITYYPERNYHECKCPDKAVLYSFVSTDVDRDTIETTAYQLTNGYNSRYKNTYDVNKRMYMPFDNIVWYAEKEGCGVYATCGDDKTGFVSQDLIHRVKTDYFLLYMSLLQQSYTLLHMSEEIATKVSSNKADVLRTNSEMTEYLEDLETRISLFIVKNVYASVSHVGHHNLFHTYVEKQLRIKEDIETLRDGLNALDEIHRRREMEEEEKRSETVKNIFAFIAIIGVLTIPHEVDDFCNVWVGMSSSNVLEIVVLVIATVLAVYLMGYLFIKSKSLWGEVFPMFRKEFWVKRFSKFRKNKDKDDKK